MKIKTFTHHLFFLIAVIAISFAAKAQDVLPAIYSPGFEDPDYGDAWEDWGNSYSNEDASFVHGGAVSIMVDPGGGGIGQSIAEFTPETEISLSAWAISDAAFDSETYIGFYFDDEEFKSAVDAVHPDGWKQLCVTATIPAGTGELWVYFWYDGDTTGTVNTYVDDFKIEWGNTCQYLNVDDPSVLNSAVSVYPNPATGPIQISVGAALIATSHLEVFDITGKLVTRINDLNGQKNITMDISSFDSGIYLGTINSEAGVHTFKIIKR